MSSLFTILTFLTSVALAATSYKWTGLNPHRVEDGPGWLGALWCGLQVSLIFLIALALMGAPYTKTASFLYYYACGSVIGPAFWTSFTPAPEEEPNFIIRWWKGKLNAIGDGLLKLLITVILALFIGLFLKDALFWVTTIFAFVLLIGKIKVANLVGDSNPELVRIRKNVLILGNVYATAVIGTIATLCWTWLAHGVVDKFPPLLFSDYITVAGLIAGILLHTL